MSIPQELFTIIGRWVSCEDLLNIALCSTKHYIVIKPMILLRYLEYKQTCHLRKRVIGVISGAIYRRIHIYRFDN